MKERTINWHQNVALRKESVDRNEGGGFGCTASAGVALRKESVDRNVFLGVERRRRVQSLSARRAWIEIPTRYGAVPCRMVALRKESVDRNTYSRIMIFAKVMSLSARRAWIEIRLHRPPHTGPGGRSPQGERG